MSTLLEKTLSRIRKPSEEWREKASAYISTLAMPPGALGRLLELAGDLASIQETLCISVERKKIILMAADHGITDQGVSSSPKEVTAQMIRSFVEGNSGVCVLSKLYNAQLIIADAGVDADLSAYGEKIVHGKIRYGTSDFSLGKAMTREEAIASLELGITLCDRFEAETDLFATGDMGIGNTSSASAITSLLTGKDLSTLVGMGAGLPPEKIVHKYNMIRRGIQCNAPDRKDPLDILSKVGGLEIGGIAGVILGAAAHKKPVLVDGFISGAAALLVAGLAPEAVPYMIFSHRSAEPGADAVSEKLQKKPLLDLGLRLGEGSGCACAMPLLDQACAVMNQMATLQSLAIHLPGGETHS